MSIKSPPVWLSTENAKETQIAIAQKYGCMEGEKDAGHLHMAMTKPENHHYYSGISDIPELAAIYMMGIAKSHAFCDCNKRTAIIVGNVF